MSSLRALVTAFVWWATSIAVSRSVGSSIGSTAGLGLACIVAGALGGGCLRGGLFSAVLVAIDGVGRSSRWAAAAGALNGRGVLAAGGLAAELAPLLLPVALGIVAGGLARRASSGARAPTEVSARPERGGWLGSPWDARPDLALRLMLVRKDWAGAAELAETLGMPRSASRWRRAAGEPERARNAAQGSAEPSLELAEPPGRHGGTPPESSPRLELENPRTVRFTIDPPDDGTSE